MRKGPIRRGDGVLASALGKLSGVTVDISPLRESIPFRFLLVGQSLGWLGKHMRIVALAWQVYSITGSSIAVGMLGLTELVPLVILSQFAGAIADSHDRRRIMWWSQAGSVGASLALAGLAVMHDAPLVAIYALSAIAASFDALDSPARMAIVPSLVGWRGLAPAFALRQILVQVTQIVGPALGGIMIASFSVASVYLVDAATFIASITMLTWVPSQRPPPGVQVSRLEAVKEGLRFALGKRLLRAIFLVDLAAMIFGMPRALFPELADEVFGIGAAGVGILYSAPAVGALIGAMFSGWVNNVSRQGPAIFIAVGGWGIAITLTGFALPNLPLTLVFLAIAGAADVLSAVFRGTLLHQSTPDSLRGRVTSVNTLATVGGPRLGDMEAGTAAALMGLRGSVVFGGVACLIVTALIAFRYPELRRFERSEGPSPSDGAPESEPRPG